uniref:protein-tyrosine-phosphatase n=1 Tax=Sinocyclocheilus grahami TaxID=75366 RepID=A0A672QPB1_SINGR
MHESCFPGSDKLSAPLMSILIESHTLGDRQVPYREKLKGISLSTCLRVIPCTCSRGVKHSWSRLKVDISDLPDTVQEGLALKHRCFDHINECIDASTEKRKRVLVHCRDGFSLAPTCIIQYLMVKQNMRLIAAYELLRAKHPVNIRESHQNVLVSLERALRPGGNTDPECFKQAISRKVAWT